MDKTEFFVDYERFSEAVDRVIVEERSRVGIGRLSEKVLHAAIKLYIEPDTNFHEVKVGRSVADIKRENEIFEIQTAKLSLLKNKLEIFLEENSVTVIHPVYDIKRLIWIESNGEMSKPHKSTVRAPISRALYELWGIKEFLDRPNFRLVILLVDIDEYRLKNGWSKDGKRGSVRYERIPKALKGVVTVGSTDELYKLLPEKLPCEFNAKEFAKLTRLGRWSGSVLKFLTEVGAVEHIRNDGRAYIYRRKEER